MKTRRRLLISLLMLLLGSAAVADPGQVGPRPDAKGDAHVAYTPQPGDIGREGGEDMFTAVPIPGLPFSDTGNTCDNVNDYDETCPYSGSFSPDVVYSFSAPYNIVIDIDLCASTYDTKVYVYRDNPGNLVACNDDAGCGYSGWQSLIEHMPVEVGSTYYIVIDGYGGDCGDYVLDIWEWSCCIVECPPDGEAEGEPPLEDNHVDCHNGGCNSPNCDPPNPFQLLAAQDEDGCLTFCGRSGTYLYQGLNYRDTDWFEVTAIGDLIEWTLESESSVYGFQLSTGDCNNVSVIQQMTADPGTQAFMSIGTAPGQLHWLWVGPTVFSGLPEFDYVMTVCGIGGVVPTERSSWGTVKDLYR